MLQKLRLLYQNFSPAQKFVFYFVCISLVLQTFFWVYLRTIAVQNQVELPSSNPSNPAFTQVTAQSVTISAPFPTIPATIPIYSATVLTAEEIHQLFITQFNLTPSPTLSWFAGNSDNSITSLLDLNRKRVGLTRISPAKNEIENTTVEMEKVIAAAQTFVNTLNLNTTFEVDQKSTKKYENTHFNEVEEPQQHEDEVYSVGLIQKINEYPIIYSDRVDPTISALVSNNYWVKQVFVDPLITSNQAIGENNTISARELTEALENFQVTVLLISDGSQTYPDYRSFERVTITDISIQYRINSEEKLLIPYFYMEGTGYIGSAEAQLQFIYPVSK